MTTSLTRLLSIGLVVLFFCAGVLLLSPQDALAAGNTVSTSSSCWTSWTAMPDPACLGGQFLTWLASWLLTFGAGVLVLAGVMFDKAMLLFVVNFADTLQKYQIDTGIRNGWQMFRDLGNLAIIGVLVYVAIMTIVNSSTYGAKRLLASVVLVAVLINFSFLFAFLGIEVSNAVSGSVHKALQSQMNSTGVADAFLKSFGITDYYNGTTELANKVRNASSGGAAFIYSIVGMVAFMGIAGVLLYGSFVIFVRAVLLLFSLITASLAFATLLLPGTRRWGVIGWDAWLSNFLKAAIFGPILMVLLATTMLILDRSGQQIGANAGAALSQAGQNPAQMSTDAWTSLFLLIIATLFLFFSIRAAGSFASSIAGMQQFNMAGMMGLLGTSTVAGRLASSVVGNLAAQRMQALRTKAGKAEVAGDSQTASRLALKSQKWERMARTDLNPMNSQVYKFMAKQAGLPQMKPALTGGYLGRTEARAKKIVSESDAAGKIIAKEAGKVVEKEVLSPNSTRGDVTDIRKELAGAINYANTEHAKVSESVASEIKSLQKQITDTRASNGSDQERNAKITDLNAQIERQKSREKASLNEQATRIKEARDRTYNKERALVANEMQRRGLTQNTIAGGIAQSRAEHSWAGGVESKLSDFVRERTSEYQEEKRFKKLLSSLQPEIEKVQATTPAPTAHKSPTPTTASTNPSPATPTTTPLTRSIPPAPPHP